jgi:hypothetical protein
VVTLLTVECISEDRWRLRVVREHDGRARVSTVDGSLASIRELALGSMLALSAERRATSSAVSKTAQRVSCPAMDGETTATYPLDFSAVTPVRGLSSVPDNAYDSFGAQLLDSNDRTLVDVPRLGAR